MIYQNQQEITTKIDEIVKNAKKKKIEVAGESFEEEEGFLMEKWKGPPKFDASSKESINFSKITH